MNIEQQMGKLMGDLAKSARIVDEATAHVTPRVGVSTTEYQIKGALEPVLAVIQRLFKQYHPAGYGTYLHSLRYELLESQYVARVSRSNSCD